MKETHSSSSPASFHQQALHPTRCLIDYKLSNKVSCTFKPGRGRGLRGGVCGRGHASVSANKLSPRLDVSVTACGQESVGSENNTVRPSLPRAGPGLSGSLHTHALPTITGPAGAGHLETSRFVFQNCPHTLAVFKLS